MSAIWLCTRAQLRGRVRVTILFALLVGLAGAVVLTSFAAARRTKQALPRFLRESSGIDALAIITDPRGSAFISKYDLADEIRQVRAFPEVRSADRGAATLIQTPDTSVPTGWATQIAYVPFDGTIPNPFGRPIVVDGRMPRADRAEEVAINEEMARRRHLRVGSHYDQKTFTADQFEPAGVGESVEPAGPTAQLVVTGIVRFPSDLIQQHGAADSLLADHSTAYLSPAYWQRYGPDLARYGVEIPIVLRRGAADSAQLARHLDEAFGNRAGLATDTSAGFGTGG